MSYCNYKKYCNSPKIGHNKFIVHRICQQKTQGMRKGEKTIPPGRGTEKQQHAQN